MSEHVKRSPGSRPYDASRRRQRADENRIAMLRSAHRMFVERGYARTTMAAIAADAGVSTDLVYKTFGTKHRLVVEVLNYDATSEVDSPPVLEQTRPQEVRAEKDQRTQIRMFAADIAQRTRRVRPIDDVIRSAGEVDPVLATQRAQDQRTRLSNLQAFVGWVAANGALREGLEEEDAAATVWALTGPDMHRLLVDELGWEHQRYADWIRDTLTAVLLPPPADRTT